MSRCLWTLPSGRQCAQDARWTPALQPWGVGLGFPVCELHRHFDPWAYVPAEGLQALRLHVVPPQRRRYGIRAQRVAFEPIRPGGLAERASFGERTSPAPIDDDGADYVPAVDRLLPEDRQRRFRLRRLAPRVKALILDRFTEISDDGLLARTDPGRAAVMACRFGIETWSNVRDRRGLDVACRRAPVGDDLAVAKVHVLPGPLVMEIGGRILAMGAPPEALRVTEPEPAPGR